MKISFRNKIIVSYLLVIVVAFGFIAFFLDRTLERNVLADLKTSLINQAWLIEERIPQAEIAKDASFVLQALSQTLSQKIRARITIINARGVVLADSDKDSVSVAAMENHAQRLEVKQALAGAVGEQIRYSDTFNKDMLYIAVPIGAQDNVLGVARLAIPLTTVESMQSQVKKSIIISLMFALGLAFMVGSLLAVGIIKPLGRIIYASGKFAQGDFTHTIFVDSQDELGQLAQTLNAMAQALEHKIQEAQVQNQHLKAILESMVEGIIVVDNTTRIISINPKGAIIFSLNAETARNRLFLEVIPNSDIAEIIKQVVASGEVASRELSLIWPVHKIFRIDASPVFEKNVIQGCLLVIHDITEIRRLETMRRDFVANVSHELKTPLTSIKGFIETLLEGALEDKENSRHFLEIIRTHTERLNTLINDLLDLSCLESKGFALSLQQCSLKQMADKVIAGFKSQLKNKKITIVNELSSECVVRADSAKIEQVMTNLIDNAIKFNKEQGSIRIYAEMDDNRNKISVEDTGMGIPA
ncbi:MAG: HAMP domain-containing protein, partial [Candidatus Omnitrophica bacterium]|nr:HAMP domain-containing protein [Candidatus Omnitrophota bacterium]